ncbi:MAG: signal peptide peptidase SppA [Rhodobiaceae bacterium]|nr:signal peptide peptidase SppA [Rhodobiaceae bacterium]MCC0013952.1 signal peptide peptidase SppA [Rhodobiaceae bacterium]MCC0017960.1 signal peptide peptidase SppA [Rhodobiaceae bacterium]MCC0062088.1 signal peptide peptidase SppA [Rhodobiaceae bacterium]
MALDADTMVERRRLRRKLSFWRIFAFVIAVIAILAVAGIGAKDSFGEQIARVPITGVISDDWSQREFLRKLGETERVKAVILAINSPGGTTAGGEALYEAIRKLSGKKPVVATIGTVGASAAYLAAIAADRVIARETSITGSVGVLFQWANFKELADKVGVDMRVVKSDPLKAEPSPFNEDTPEETRVLADLIEDSHKWFLERLAERRDMTAAEARALGNGRIYSGRRALDLKIIDAIGGEETAKAWLVSEHGISEDAEIVEWTANSTFDEFGLSGRLSALLGQIDGLQKLVTRIAELASADGLVSVWKPQAIED